MQTPDCSFVLSVEQGKLEAQAILLVESLRRFGGAYANCPVYAVSPRPARQMGTACAAALTALGVQIITRELLPLNEAYGTVARMAACAWAEQNLSSEIIVSLDDDLFFTGEPDFRLQGGDFFARPVDIKGMCTSGPNDPCDHYWHQIAQLAGIDYDEIPWVETTVDHIWVKASYNGGMVAVRRRLGLFQKTMEIFQSMRKNNLAPYQALKGEVFSSIGYVGPEATRWWGSAQAALSMAVIRQKAIIALAPPTYNVPAHEAVSAERPMSTVTLKDAVLIHYHWLLDSEYTGKSPFFHANSTLSPDMIAWLKYKTPLGKSCL